MSNTIRRTVSLALLSGSAAAMAITGVAQSNAEPDTDAGPGKSATSAVIVLPLADAARVTLKSDRPECVENRKVALIGDNGGPAAAAYYFTDSRGQVLVSPVSSGYTVTAVAFETPGCAGVVSRSLVVP